MPRHSPHHHESDPEDRFDHWLDALVSGTPGSETSREDDTGRLARAQAGARQLHGLAAQTAMPGAAAQRRIKEDLMHTGALSPGGSMWIPNRRQERRVPWWSPASPVLATALAIAVIVALVGSLVRTQLPATSPAPTDAPGFAVSSPDATPASGTDVSDLLIVRGLSEEEARALSDHVGVLDEDGFTIFRADGTITLDGASEVVPTGVPGQAMVIWAGGQRSVVDLKTGEALFELPDVTERESFVNPYLFVSDSGDNADWVIHDLRTGESRPLSEIVELPADQPAIPVRFGPYSQEAAVAYLHFVTPEYEVSPTSDIPSFLIAGSLARATSLDGYPPASQARTQLPVVSHDGERVAWTINNNDLEPDEVVVADTETGEELARFEVGREVSDPQLAGFVDAETLVITTRDEIRLLSWADDEQQQETVADGLSWLSSPLLHAPSQNLYFSVNSTAEGWELQRMSLDDGSVSTVLTLESTSLTRFTTPQGPWIITDQGADAALIDARTGEIVSQLSDVPPNEAEFNAVSTSMSFDGSTVIEMIGGAHSGYVVSPHFPDGLVLTAPIDPEVIAASESPDGIPVNYRLSLDGTTVVAGTIDEGGYAPRFIAPVEPDPEWVPINPGVTNLYWLPMPDARDESPTPETLPAQDFATPLATPASRVATPEVTEGASELFIVEGEADQARIEGDVAIATLGEDGLTVPLASGEPVTMPDVVGVPLTLTLSAPGQVLVTRDNQPPAMIDLTTGEVLHELPEFQTWGQFFGRYYMVPTDATLTDWTITDLRTGDTRLLSDVVDLPGDSAVMPFPAFDSRGEDAAVFEVSEGTIDDLRFNPSPRSAGTFVIGGSLDRMVEIAGFPTARDRVGSPAMVAVGEGRFIAYETRVDNARIVIVDTATGEELARYVVDAVGEDPTLAGFTGDAQSVVITSGDRVMMLSTQGGEPLVMREGLEDIANPLFYPGEAALYFTQVDTVMRLILPGNELTEVARGFVPNTLALTKPGSDWIVFQTQDGHMLVDARTGEVVSQLEAPGNRAHFPEPFEQRPWWTDASGDTVIFAIERTGPNTNAAPGAVWLLSPEFPDGLEIAGPDDQLSIGNVYLSPDGMTLYASTSESMSSPDDLWATPLGDEPAWQLIAEDVEVAGYYSLAPEE